MKRVIFYVAMAFVLVIITSFFGGYNKSRRLAKKPTRLLHEYADSLKCPLTKFRGGKRYYSQYYEDYILAYIFDGQDKGFYIDVGANHPTDGNVTMSFYEKGWRGINIEPQIQFIKMFEQARPSDINLNLAVSNEEGSVVLLIPKNNEGWASLDEHERLIKKAKTQGFNEFDKVIVKTTTLNKILAEKEINEIDFIKIDVAGHEAKVVQGIDLERYRPLVLVVESKSPLNHFGYLTFEEFILNQGYKFGMSDELNRYYYRQESPELGEKFRSIRRCVVLDQLARDAYCQNEDYCKF